MYRIHAAQVTDFFPFVYSKTVHMFGAYFGLAVSYILGPPKPSSSSNADPNAVSDLLALLGTVRYENVDMFVLLLLCMKLNVSVYSCNIRVFSGFTGLVLWAQRNRACLSTKMSASFIQSWHSSAAQEPPFT